MKSGALRPPRGCDSHLGTPHQTVPAATHSLLYLDVSPAINNYIIKQHGLVEDLQLKVELINVSFRFLLERAPFCGVTISDIG